MITLKEIADRHNMDPHSVRVLLRSTGIRAEGRWQWEDDDPFLAEIEKLIESNPSSSRQPRIQGKASPKPNIQRPISNCEMPDHVPSPAKMIERLDRLASSGKYDDVSLVFELETHVIHSWQTHRLRNLEWIMSKGELPIAFIGFKWHGSRLDLRIWNAPWETYEGSMIAAEWLVCNTPRPEYRTDFDINQDWGELG